MSTSTDVRVGSLFTGGGGLDMAVKMLWPESRIAWTAENDKAAARLLATRYLASINHGDLRDVDWSDVEPVDILVGGYPCQPWSNAGKRKGFDDERDGWPWFRDAISVLRPRLVLLENVAGHLVGGAPRTVGDLAALGYVGSAGTLRASDVGAPHQRDRWFAVAWSADTDVPRLEGRDGAGVPERPHERLAGARGPHDLTFLPTPAVNDMGEGKSVEKWDAWTDDLKARHGNGNGHGKSLSIEAQRHADQWGEYGPAIRRWERLLGRAAPLPTVPEDADTELVGSLNPDFVLWMMGWPKEWLDGAGLSRKNKLKILGNGVVPQQAAAAYGALLDRARSDLSAVA